MRQFSSFKLGMALLSGLVLLFFVAPLAGMFLSTDMGRLVESAQDREVQDSIFLSLWTAFASTTFFAVLAIPGAWFLARSEFKGKKLVLGLIDVPVVIPHTAAGIALLGILSRDTPLGKAAASIGIEFMGSAWGIAIAMAFVSLPFLLTSAIDAFQSVPPRLEQAALTLGAGPVRVFLTISLPLAWRGIISGMVMMFARGMSEFGAVVIVAYHPMTAPVLIYERFGAFGLSYTQPVAVLFIAMSLFIFILFRTLAPRVRKLR
jgi:molybdate/tungstate transport system permease protein